MLTPESGVKIGGEMDGLERGIILSLAPRNGRCLLQSPTVMLLKSSAVWLNESFDLEKEGFVLDDAISVLLLLETILIALSVPFNLCRLVSTSLANWLKYSISSLVILLSARAAMTSTSLVGPTVLTVPVVLFGGDGVFVDEPAKQMRFPIV